MNPFQPHGHRFDQIERLRTPERVARLEVARVVDLALDGIAAGNLLDVGIGSALFSEAFARRGLAIAGIDANRSMLRAARGYLPGASLAQAVAEDLPFPDRAFDLVFMGLVLHETDDLLKALQAARRVARQRVAVLEWPYRMADFGPGLEERLSPEMLISLSEQAQLGKITALPLESLVFYRLEVA